MLLCTQVLIVGKISQAVVIAAAAYRTEAEFKERTGIQKSKLIVDDTHTNTHVSLPMRISCMYPLSRTHCLCLKHGTGIASGAPVAECLLLHLSIGVSSAVSLCLLPCLVMSSLDNLGRWRLSQYSGTKM